MAERTIILHYHLFKNAGTSLDRILQKNFPDRWVTREFPRNGGNNSALVADWIRAERRAVAFSSHTMLGPVPAVPGVRIISVIVLRDPVARIVSAYRFERRQSADTLGAQMAKDHDLEGYVRGRLAIPGDRQCRNFQTYRLASFVPGPEPELDRAMRALDVVSLVGLVERFGESITRLGEIVRPDFPDFKAEVVHENVADKTDDPLDDGMRQFIQAHNSADLELLRRATEDADRS